MSLEQYLVELKKISLFIQKELSKYHNNTEELYNQGPGIGYTYTEDRKKTGKHYDYICFDSSFSNIETEVGGFQLCTSSGYKTTDKEYYTKINNIIQTLGLVRKEREIYNYNSSSKLYETYYEMKFISLNIHTYEEIKQMWEQVK